MIDLPHKPAGQAKSQPADTSSPLPTQQTVQSVGQGSPQSAGQQTPECFGEKSSQSPTKRPPLKAYLPRGKTFRYLTANAVKVHLWLLRHYQRRLPPTEYTTTWTVYGETVIAQMADAVGLKDKTVYRALDELVDFGLARREKRRSNDGVILGLAYWLLPASKGLTEQAIHRLKTRLINSELATEEAKRKLAQDGIVFKDDVERRRGVHEMFRAQPTQPLPNGHKPPTEPLATRRRTESSPSPTGPTDPAPAPPTDHTEAELSPTHEDQPEVKASVPAVEADAPEKVKKVATKTKGKRHEALSLLYDILKREGGRRLPDLAQMLQATGYKPRHHSLSQDVHKLLIRMIAGGVVRKSDANEYSVAETVDDSEMHARLDAALAKEKQAETEEAARRRDRKLKERQATLSHANRSLVDATDILNRVSSALHSLSADNRASVAAAAEAVAAIAEDIALHLDLDMPTIDAASGDDVAEASSHDTADNISQSLLQASGLLQGVAETVQDATDDECADLAPAAEGMYAAACRLGGATE